MVSDKSEPRISVTPLKRASRFQKNQKTKSETAKIDETKFKPFDVTFNGREIFILYNSETGEIIINGKLYTTNVQEFGRIVKTEVEKEHVYSIEYHDGQIFLEGRLIDFNFHESVPKLIRQKTISTSQEIVIAPLPGQVVTVSVKVGDKMMPGQKIITLEAMKMQNDILCQLDGTVAEVYVIKGEQVSTNQKLVLIKTDR